MPGHVGGRQGLLPDQQELRQRAAGAGTPLLQGQDDGGDRRARDREHFLSGCSRSVAERVNASGLNPRNV